MIDKSVRRAAIVMAVAFCSLASAQNSMAQDINAAVDKAVKHYAAVKTAKGSLQQTNTTAIRTHNLVGDFQQQFPNLLSIRYSEPKGELLVADGKSLISYSPTSDSTTATRISLNGAGASVNLIGVFLDNPHAKYTMTDAGKLTINGHATRAVGLVPKQPMTEFRRATVWIEETTGIIWQFEFTEASGTVRKVTFGNNLAFNTPVDAAQFKFTAPRGVKIKDAGGQRD